MPDARPDLGIVVPAFNEQESLPQLAAELDAELGGAGVSFELLLVDDGSRDRTAEVIRELAARNRRVRGLILSRNFGHQAAVSVGLQYARGRAIAVMDADLQDRPADLLALYRRWERGDADVVYAVRRTRRESRVMQLAYRTFYRVLARVAKVSIPIDSGDFCVMDASFVQRLNELPERVRFVRGLRAWLGGRQVAVPVDRAARRAGQPQYTLPRLVRLASDGVVSFSDMPLRLASVVGVLVSLAAFAGAVVVLVWKLLGLLPSGAGIATIALSVLFLGGIQLLTIGILGEYIGRIYEEIKGRPVAVVSQVVGAEVVDEQVGPVRSVRG